VTSTSVQDVSGRLYLAVGRLSRSLRQAGVPGPGHGAISALATLVHAGQLRLGDLAAKEGVAAATMSRIIASLVEAGYVSRESDPVDPGTVPPRRCLVNATMGAWTPASRRSRS